MRSSLPLLVLALVFALSAPSAFASEVTGQLTTGSPYVTDAEQGVALDAEGSVEAPYYPLPQLAASVTGGVQSSASAEDMPSLPDDRSWFIASAVLAAVLASIGGFFLLRI